MVTARGRMSGYETHCLAWTGVALAAKSTEELPTAVGVARSERGATRPPAKHGFLTCSVRDDRGDTLPPADQLVGRDTNFALHAASLAVVCPRFLFCAHPDSDRAARSNIDLDQIEGRVVMTMHAKFKGHRVGERIAEGRCQTKVA